MPCAILELPDSIPESADIWTAGLKMYIMKFCLMRKEKALRSVPAITHVYVVKFDIFMLFF